MMSIATHILLSIKHKQCMEHRLYNNTNNHNYLIHKTELYIKLVYLSLLSVNGILSTIMIFSHSV